MVPLLFNKELKMDDGKVILLSATIGTLTILAFSVPLLLGLGWTYSFALFLTVFVGATVLINTGVLLLS